MRKDRKQKAIVTVERYAIINWALENGTGQRRFAIPMPPHGSSVVAAGEVTSTKGYAMVYAIIEDSGSVKHLYADDVKMCDAGEIIPMYEITDPDSLKYWRTVHKIEV